ncbi:MAG: phenylalanine 4-monooxygenase [Burkholderiaceae bacterium]
MAPNTPDRKTDHYTASHPDDLPQAADYTVQQPLHLYTEQDHQTWRTLYARQAQLLNGRACDEYLRGLQQLRMSHERVPDFNELNDILRAHTGWQIVAVNGLVPDAVFFDHLANRRFPCTWWMRRPEQMDYLQEPDCFHDVFGHVPLLINPVFADYMQAYGEGGLKAERLQVLPMLARLYWYTVEFGLIQTADGLRIYGAGIVSSKAESLYSLDSDAPHRVGFDLRRILRTEYKIDDVQKTYFVIRDFAQLFDQTRADFTLIYDELKALPSFSADQIQVGDQIVSRT